MIEVGQNLAQYDDIARKCRYMELKIKEYQNSFNTMEKVFCYL